MIRGGWVITASWPLATESTTRLALDSAALATSIHLVCRPRPAVQLIGDWIAVYRELPRRVSTWMTRLEAEGIRARTWSLPASARRWNSTANTARWWTPKTVPSPSAATPQPASRTAAATSPMCGRRWPDWRWSRCWARAPARAARPAWRKTPASPPSSCGRCRRRMTAAPQRARRGRHGGARRRMKRRGAGGRKPKGLSLPFDVARRFAQPLGIHLDVWQGRIIAIDKGVVRLLPVGALAHQLFGTDGADAVAGELERSPLRATCNWVSSPSSPRRLRPAVAAPASPWPTMRWALRPAPPRWIASTPPCCSRRADARMRCAHCSPPSRSGGRRSCAWQTRCRGYIRGE